MNKDINIIIIYQNLHKYQLFDKKLGFLHIALVNLSENIVVAQLDVGQST